MTNKQIIGYTCGVYDLFHIGHLNLIKNAKSICDKLIVGVTIDELVQYKGKQCIIPYKDRAEIVSAIKYVDCVIPQTSHDKLEAYHKLKYDVLIVGDDWYQTDNWNNWEKDLNKFGVIVRYFPYTQNISTTQIVKQILQK